MMVRLFRSLLAMLVAVAFIGAPAMQAAIAMPCDPIVASAIDHQLSSDHGPASTPCKEMMPGCADMQGCGGSVSLYAPSLVLATQPIWTATAYWPVVDSLESLSIEPDLGPPITI
jgi:hypothetical protein